jgi:hypothetical protein
METAFIRQIYLASRVMEYLDVPVMANVSVSRGLHI